MPGLLLADARGQGVVVELALFARQSWEETTRLSDDAMDAAVATSFAVGVVEPWMNGLGGGGFLVAWLARERRAVVVEYRTSIEAGDSEALSKLYAYYDPIHTLPISGQAWWASHADRSSAPILLRQGRMIPNMRRILSGRLRFGWQYRPRGTHPSAEDRVLRHAGGAEGEVPVLHAGGHHKTTEDGVYP